MANIGSTLPHLNNFRTTPTASLTRAGIATGSLHLYNTPLPCQRYRASYRSLARRFDFNFRHIDDSLHLLLF